jgi:hypothetical protein
MMGVVSINVVRFNGRKIENIGGCYGKRMTATLPGVPKTSTFTRGTPGTKFNTLVVSRFSFLSRPEKKFTIVND